MPKIAYVFFAFVIISFIGAATACSKSTEVEPTTSYVRVYTDPVTGCQYLTKFDARTGLIPRVDRNGNHLCAIESE